MVIFSPNLTIFIWHRLMVHNVCVAACAYLRSWVLCFLLLGMFQNEFIASFLNRIQNTFVISFSFVLLTNSNSMTQQLFSFRSKLNGGLLAVEGNDRETYRNLNAERRWHKTALTGLDLDLRCCSTDAEQWDYWKYYVHSVTDSQFEDALYTDWLTLFTSFFVLL